MNVNRRQSTVFVPKSICDIAAAVEPLSDSHDCVWLYGFRNNSKRLACVTSYTYSCERCVSSSSLRSPSISADSEFELELIAVVFRGKNSSDHALHREIHVFRLHDCKLVLHQGASEAYVIFYDADDILSPCSFVEHLVAGNDVEFVIKACRSACLPVQEAALHVVSALVKHTGKNTQTATKLFAAPVFWLCKLLACFQVSNAVLHKLPSSPLCPSIINCLITKQKLAGEIAVADSQNAAVDQRTKRLRSDVLAIQFCIDIILGVLLMALLLKKKEVLCETLSAFGEVIVGGLYQLLDWLMGAPAGLKLNRQLDLFLGKFFSYHVWLWAGYLDYQSQHASVLVNVVAAAGVLGLSTQIALAQDLVALSTMHLYCFYLYMARLYNLQVAALLSFWRLFRGKKWNSLRKRVDTAEYDVQQLFIGTLLLAVIFFLLPTLALYYMVFMVFRLAVCLIQIALQLAGSIIQHCYWYLLFLRLSKSLLLVGGVADYRLSEKHTVVDSSSALYLSMQVKPVSYNLTCQTMQLKPLPQIAINLSATVSSIFIGNLV